MSHAAHLIGKKYEIVEGPEKWPLVMCIFEQENARAIHFEVVADNRKIIFGTDHIRITRAPQGLDAFVIDGVGEAYFEDRKSMQWRIRFEATYYLNTHRGNLQFFPAPRNPPHA